MESKSGICRHVVLFQFNDNTAEDTLREIEQAFRSLCASLPFVDGFEWGRNSSPEGLNDGFTHCFVITFPDEGARNTYLPHPEHVAFCRRHLDPHLKKACVVDFTPTA